jgi:hypothetical protein
MSARMSVAAGLLLSVGLLGSGPARAGGALLVPDASLIGADEAPEISQIRAVLVRDGEGSVLAVQAQLRGRGPRVAWIVPVPSGHVGQPRGLGDGNLEALLDATDPYYATTTAGCGSGCSENISSDSGFGDTGVGGSLDVRTFGDRYQRGQVGIFPAEQLATLVDELSFEGFVVEEKVLQALTAQAAQGWSFAVLRLQQTESDSDATPLFAIRSAGTELVLPMAVSQVNAAATPIQVTVLAMGSERIEPSQLPATTVRLGAPLYEPRFTPTFYNSRVDVAIEEAGGKAWVLEYAGPMSNLQARLEELDPLTSGDTSKLLKRMGVKELLSDDGLNSRWVTRWRTFLDGDELVDETFVEAAGPAYEVTISSDEYLGSSEGSLWPALLLWPLAMLGWGVGRRRG